MRHVITKPNTYAIGSKVIADMMDRQTHQVVKLRYVVPEVKLVSNAVALRTISCVRVRADFDQDW